MVMCDYKTLNSHLSIIVLVFMATETTNKEDTKPMTISSPFHLINQTKTSNLELKTKAMNIQSVILH